MVAVGPRFFALLLLVSAVLFYLTVISYENRLSGLQSRLSFVERRLSSPTAEPQKARDETIVIYNRVPKTGSTTFMGLCYDICERHGFNVIHLNTSKNAHVMSFVDQMKFVTNITSWKQRLPAFYHGHIAFIDFASLGFSQRPVYINVIRRPMERLVSHYYFLRHGDDFRPHLVRLRAGDTETFDDCVRLNHTDCQPKLMWLQVPFFCGMAAFCWEPGNREALEAAKFNLVHHYLLVGTTDRLREFIAMLEVLMPRMFSGAIRALEKGGKSHLRRTQGKLEPSAETKAALQATAEWQLEEEFYQFAEQQFLFVRQRTMVVTQTGRLRPRQPAYHYEKIRPNRPK